MSDDKVRKILILDDEEAIRDSFKYYFEDQGWEIWTAESTEEALKELQEQSPDCAVVDIRLPGESGDVFIQKASKLQPGMSFVICTGSPEFHQDEHIHSPVKLSGRVFNKPVNNMKELEDELLGLMMGEDPEEEE